MGIQHRLTSKSQVTVPKDVRVAMGLRPGDCIEFIREADGRFSIVKGQAPAAETREQRHARILAALKAAEGSIDLDGMSTDEYMRWLRGDWEP
jgi:antitoxin PrlF